MATKIKCPECGAIVEIFITSQEVFWCPHCDKFIQLGTKGRKDIINSSEKGDR